MPVANLVYKKICEVFSKFPMDCYIKPPKQHWLNPASVTPDNARYCLSNKMSHYVRYVSMTAILITILGQNLQHCCVPVDSHAL